MAKPALMLMNRYGDENAALKYSSLLISADELDKGLGAEAQCLGEADRHRLQERRFVRLWDEAGQAGKGLGLGGGFLLTCLRGGVFRDCGDFCLFAPIVNYCKGTKENPKPGAVLAREDEAFTEMFFERVAKEWGAAAQREDFEYPRDWLAEPVGRYIGLAKRQWAKSMALHEKVRLSEAAGLPPAGGRRRGV